MALNKQVITDNGIEINYHRIMQVGKKGLNMIEVVLHSYKDSSYRDKEKLNEQNIIRRDEIDNRSQEIWDMGEDISEELYDELSRLSEERDSLTIVDNPFFIYDTSVSYIQEDSDDISFSQVYEKLKTIEPFMDAEDC